MTASVTLSKSSFEDSCFCNESSRRKYASRSQVYGIVQEHNQSGGNRLLNFSEYAKACFGRAYGPKSLGWTLGDYNTGKAVEIISANAGRALRAFFGCSTSSGVIVMERRPDEHGIMLVRKEMVGNPRYLLSQDSTILLPVGVTSPRLKGGMLYERIDLTSSHNSIAPFSVRRVLFTGENGESIAGVSDANGSFYVKNLPDLNPTIHKLLGDGFDQININGRIFSAMQLHLDCTPWQTEIEIPILGEEHLDAVPTMYLKLEGGNAWSVEFNIHGERLRMEAIAPKRRYLYCKSQVENARYNLTKALRALPDFNGRIDFATVFDAKHLNRVPASFREEYEADPTAAMAKFAAKANESLQRFKVNPNRWGLVTFSAGAERSLVYSGETANTSIQMCAPLYLTDEDERIERASTYAVVELLENMVSIPSILDHEMAIADMNNLARGTKNDDGMIAA